jgi:hypothetical protein
LPELRDSVPVQRPADNRDVGLSGCWAVGLLGCCVMGLLDCWLVAKTVDQSTLADSPLSSSFDPLERSRPLRISSRRLRRTSPARPSRAVSSTHR